MRQLSTGDMLRGAIKAGTPVGLQAKAVMDRGELVSDEIVSALIVAELDAMGPETGAIFDGYPRTEAQAHSLDGILDGCNRKLDHVIELVVDEDALVERITGRYTCASCGKGYRQFEQPKVAGVCDKCGGTDSSVVPTTMSHGAHAHGGISCQDRADPAGLYEARGIVQRVDGMAAMDAVTAAIAAISVKGFRPGLLSPMGTGPGIVAFCLSGLIQAGRHHRQPGMASVFTFPRHFASGVDVDTARRIGLGAPSHDANG
jgi:adenylate kinase